MSLLQIGDLEIIHITKKEARIKGYVLPPVYMLKRFTEQKNIFTNKRNGQVLILRNLKSDILQT